MLMANTTHLLFWKHFGTPGEVQSIVFNYLMFTSKKSYQGGAWDHFRWEFRWDGSIKANVEARIFSAWNAFRKPPARVHTVVNEKYDKLVVSWVCCLCLQSCLHHILSRFNKVWWWTPERNEWIGKQTIFFNGKNTH